MSSRLLESGDFRLLEDGTSLRLLEETDFVAIPGPVARFTEPGVVRFREPPALQFIEPSVVRGRL